MKLKIAFVHPDLGVGGAERLVVDAAMGLKGKGHEVEMMTSHHDASHAFTETTDGSLKVTVRGDFLPRHIVGKFHIFFAILRNVFLAFCMGASRQRWDVIVCDQISASIPILRILNPTARIVFYCHYPDLLLSSRTSFLKQIYRFPFDYIEEKTTSWAHTILVNSHFTKHTFEETFKSIKKAPEVLYPCIKILPDDFAVIEDNISESVREAMNAKTVFVSINRYERKKKIEIAVKALGVLKENLSEEEFSGVRLVVAGGYDERVRENVEHHLELQQWAEGLGLKNHVVFIRSFSDADKQYLLRNATAVIYTPANEHFGIVPIECMEACAPVIAVNNGGPLESVRDGKDGFLCEQEPIAFAQAMQKLMNDEELAIEMGKNGRDRVKKNFSFQAFSDHLHDVCTRAAKSRLKKEKNNCRHFLWIMLILLGILSAFGFRFWSSMVSTFNRLKMNRD
eukprot:TRINITY_DN775854_c0_g1_i1.p1 TRINITY_DN775854_c0_g1~~TRINITY_DN775854_c0_g1_i1.p1  ORF type:complete len:484 (-),score=110.10 TRINITY_DN775854_c0_g1_i1:113-1471(-)